MTTSPNPNPGTPRPNGRSHNGGLEKPTYNPTAPTAIGTRAYMRKSDIAELP